MAPTLRPLPEGAEGETVLCCIRCRLRIIYGHRQVLVVSDLLATHWADDHHLPGWRDAAAKARDRLWRRHPDLLETLTSLAGAAGAPGDCTG